MLSFSTPTNQIEIYLRILAIILAPQDAQEPQNTGKNEVVGLGPGSGEIVFSSKAVGKFVSK
jgi:hypothetical protein